MTKTSAISTAIFTFLACILPSQGRTAAAADPFQLHRGDHVVYIGNTLADRMQHHAWLETYLHALHPEHELTFRNLGFSADEIKRRQRSDNFGNPDQWLSKCEADVVFCFFGYNEALKGEDELTQFSDDLAELIDGMRAQTYNGESAPRLVVFSPIAHENLNSPHLPDGSENNRKLDRYTHAMERVCELKNVLFVDLFSITNKLYAQAAKPLTMNGIHLLDHGNLAVAKEVLAQLMQGTALPAESRITNLREAVLDKNYHWFSRYRVVDGYNVFGGRSKLTWHEQSNADVMRREMEVFDIKTENRDKRVWAVAQGGELTVTDDNIPENLVVETNKVGPLEGGAFPYLGGQEAISEMTVASGMEINLFASEEQFPRLVNPVQMAVDTDSRLWVSVWHSYPHWNPTEPRKDALVILPDEDGDGKADDLIVFADELNSITGFEFWGGGVLVAAPPEIWFLKDSDGDDKADVKIRMLQGVSSADTHHSANAWVVGPGGWLYWSRGIFNVAAFETPTRTHRSGASGVHRFNPRTFEVGFQYPIGPNPHGDVFDQWGYQFANDGTGGTGGYVSIGKGLRPGGKQWFKQRVRPVAATGILSSSHFPDENQGNFLICNTIGFLGVLQHEVSYNGADITATEIEPIVFSGDPNFRPSDIEMGGDGALYISDWHNSLIGHMQHNMRDPNRDHTHGRVYRVTAQGRDLLKPAKMKGKPIEEVLQRFFAKENSTRYRARLELSGRDTNEIVAKVGEFASGLDPAKANRDRDEAQALLECLWVHEEHRVPNMDLLQRVLMAPDPRVRAAAIRTLGHWAGRVYDWENTLIRASRDASALVRAEAVKSAVEFTGLSAAEVIFEAATRGTDPEMDLVLNYAKSQIDVDALIADALDSRRTLSAAARTYVLQNAGVDDLLKLDPTEDVYRAILSRKQATYGQLETALGRLAAARGANPLFQLMDLIDEAVTAPDGNIEGLGKLLRRQPAQELARVQERIEAFATQGTTSQIKQMGYAAWIAAVGPSDAFLAASTAKDSLRDFLDAVPTVNERARGQIYAKVRPLISDLPSTLRAESSNAGLTQQGITVDYFYPSADNVAIETLAKMTPKESGIVPNISMNVPQRKADDRFALRFTGLLHVPQRGRYSFFTRSDDGSRLYIDSRLVVNNDGTHGMQEKRGRIRLSAGPHPIVVTYFDNGGGDGLSVGWTGPDFEWQSIPTERLTVSGGETLHDVAIRALASIPGHESEKFSDLASLVAAGKNRPSAIKALRDIPADHWPQKEVRPLIDNLIGYLSEMPAKYRTGAPAMDTIALAKSLSRGLPVDLAKSVEDRLQNLDVRVIAIGTVPTRMIFDKEMIVVEAGKPVEFRFSNTDHMPHNFAITQPGALSEVGELAEATGRDPDAITRHYIPESDKILLASKLLQPGENQSLSFEVPTEPGVYPYVCTYPGHWRRMYGALYVVPNLEQYQLSPDVYLASNPLTIQDDLLERSTRGRQWQFDDLIVEADPLPMGRSFEVGKELFKVASCTGCHKLNNEGLVFGPDLAQLDVKKHTTQHILRSMLEPSKDIDEKYQSYAFLLDSGKVITGMIVEETTEVVKVMIDPLAKDSATVLQKDEIEQRQKSNISLMPQGLLDKLSREEILDLLAYAYAKGDQQHKLFMEHQDH